MNLVMFINKVKEKCLDNEVIFAPIGHSKIKKLLIMKSGLCCENIMEESGDHRFGICHFKTYVTPSGKFQFHLK